MTTWENAKINGARPRASTGDLRILLKRSMGIVYYEMSFLGRMFSLYGSVGLTPEAIS